MILPHDHNGSNLDVELEENNFGFVGRTLAEIWSHLIIDNYPNVEPAISEAVEKNLSSREQNYVVEYMCAIKPTPNADREMS